MMENQPLVSIVLATYNGAAYLREQLDSLLAQNYAPFEIIAIDDSSTDSTLSILDEYALKNAFIKVHVNEANLGVVKTFEKGITLTQGQYIALCDQDDIWEKTKITDTLAPLAGNVSLVYCDSLFVDAHGNSLEKKISDTKNLKNYNSILPFVIGNTVSGHASIFKKEVALDAMPFPDFIIHDWWIAFVAAMHGEILFVDKPLVKYRQHSQNFIGGIKVKGSAKKSRANLKIIRARVNAFYDKCPSSLHREKKILLRLMRTYSSFSLSNNFNRMIIFHSFGNELLATKKRSTVRKFFFILKMFFSII